jgi:hypothetical protein
MLAGIKARMPVTLDLMMIALLKRDIPGDDPPLR